MRVKVNDGTQVNADGAIHRAGEVFDADDADASVWLREGLVTEAPKPTRRAAKR